MSMYNMAMGVNPLAGDLLSFLDVSPDSLGRFRDAWLDDQHGELRIVLHTRCGGGNRDGYTDVFERMSKHPEYVRDYDCEFDDTYANIEFKLPEAFRESMDKLLAEAEKEGVRDHLVDNRTQTDRWQAAMGKL